MSKLIVTKIGRIHNILKTRIESRFEFIKDFENRKINPIRD
jgi:hypothetical protein